MDDNPQLKTTAYVKTDWLTEEPKPEFPSERALRRYFWISLQILAQFAWFFCCYALHIRRWAEEVGAWGFILTLIYLHARAAHITGLKFLIDNPGFKKWDILVLSPQKRMGIIYRPIEVTQERVLIWVYPCAFSDTWWRRDLKVQWIKLRVFLKIIQ